MKRLKNWLKVKLCGAELSELVELKRNITEMKTWCSHIPVARECGKWLATPDGKSYPSQLKGAHGLIDDFRYFLEEESLALNERKSFINGGRSSGRTFRTVLAAVLTCSEQSRNHPKTIFIVGKHHREVTLLMHKVLSITSNVGVERSKNSVILPNNSQVKVITEAQMLELRGYERQHLVFIDHYVRGLN